MKKKWWIWVIVAVVVIVIIVVIYNAAKKAADEKEDEIDRLAEEMDYEDGSLDDNSRTERREIRKHCRKACRKGRTFVFGGRGRCRRDCKADGSSKGLAFVKANY